MCEKEELARAKDALAESAVNIWAGLFEDVHGV
jgi:hypothetical protein